MQLFAAKSPWACNIERTMTPEGNGELLPVNVDYDAWSINVFIVLYNKSLDDWSGVKNLGISSNLNVSLDETKRKNLTPVLLAKLSKPSNKDTKMQFKVLVA